MKIDPFVTESFAKRRICPIMSGDNPEHDYINCRASSCMAWLWHPTEPLGCCSLLLAASEPVDELVTGFPNYAFADVRPKKESEK